MSATTGRFRWATSYLRLTRWPAADDLSVREAVMIAEILQLQHPHGRFGGTSLIRAVIGGQPFLEIVPGYDLKRLPQVMVRRYDRLEDLKVEFGRILWRPIAEHQRILRGHWGIWLSTRPSVCSIIRFLHQKDHGYRKVLFQQLPEEFAANDVASQLNANQRTPAANGELRADCPRTSPLGVGVCRSNISAIGNRTSADPFASRLND